MLELKWGRNVRTNGTRLSLEERAPRTGSQGDRGLRPDLRYLREARRERLGVDQPTRAMYVRAVWTVALLAVLIGAVMYALNGWYRMIVYGLEP